MLYIVGAGGFGRETLDALIACGEQVDGFLDDGFVGGKVRGLPVFQIDDVSEGGYVVGVADARTRWNLIGRLRATGLSPQTVVHPEAVIAPDTEIGAGSIILANAFVSSNVILGAHVQINYNATIGHDTRVDDCATVYPGANIAGKVHLERYVEIGSNACVLQGLTVETDTFVGAGSVVVQNTGPHLVVKGSPAHYGQRQRT